MTKYIWLIAENAGRTANNNCFYFWRYIVNHYQDVDAYFIMEKNPLNQAVYDSLSAEEKKWIVKKDSIQHAKLFFHADMYFVCLGFSDVRPRKLWGLSYNPMPTAPVVHLKHGTLGIKRVDNDDKYANNCLVRYMYYNPFIREQLMTDNKLKDYQLWYGMYPPRYMELARRSRISKPHEGIRLLWFPTWREYFGNNHATNELLDDMNRVAHDPDLLAYLRQNNGKLTICLHQKFKKKGFKKVSELFTKDPNVDLLFPDQMDLMDELAANDVLITDYSSVGFDFTFLGKPVILYQPDRKKYLKGRKLYCTLEELTENSISDGRELIDQIVQATYTVNPFFEKRLPADRDMAAIEQGKYIARMYESLWELQKSCIVFFGYDFSGIGGTVFATKALAEGLREQGKLVRLFALKQSYVNRFPIGIPLHAIEHRKKDKRKVDYIKQILFSAPWHYRFLNGDHNKKHLHAVAGYGMDYWMKHIHADTLVSTRESLHFYIKESKSELVKNKVYFFHAPYNMIDSVFSPQLLKKLAKLRLEKAVFVTKENARGLAKNFGLKNFDHTCTLGNTLDSSRMVPYDEVHGFRGRQGKIRCAFLLRISKTRKPDLDRLIDFAKYLKQEKEKQILIDVYGTGDYVSTFKDRIKKEGLKSIIRHKDATSDVKSVYAEHDCVLDFSEMQSFGMTYIEALLNGKMVFCYPNPGSKEVLRDIPEAVVHSHQQMRDRILKLNTFDDKKMRRYYTLIADRFSRGVVAEKFIRYLQE